jgi:hypothetical protein
MKKLLLAVILSLVPIIAFADQYEDAANTVHSDLLEHGFKCYVELVDMDNNGIPDFKVEFITGEGSLGFLKSIIAISVANITMVSEWKSDKVFITFEGRPKFWATTADCRKCRKISEEDANNPQVVEKLVSCLERGRLNPDA